MVVSLEPASPTGLQAAACPEAVPLPDAVPLPLALADWPPPLRTPAPSSDPHPASTRARPMPSPASRWSIRLRTNSPLHF